MKAAIILAGLLALAATAHGAEFDTEQFVLTYHKVSGKPFDFDRHASLSPDVSRASGFDRPDVLRAETERLRAIHDAGTDKIEFAIDIQSSISDYDHDAGEFTVSIFEPGSYMPVQYNRQEYRVVFANAEQARAIRLPKEEARALDQQIMRDRNRMVVTPVRFRIIGEGDPNGAVGGQFVIRAELLETSIIDGDGTLLATPDLTAAPVAPAAPFNARNVDAGGLRVGMHVDELEAAVARLYRKPVRSERRPGSTSDARFGGWIEIDLMDCLFVPGSRDREPVPGDVCLKASYDAQGIVRQVRIQRVLPRFDFEQARKAAIDRFGPTTSGSMGSTPRLTWGESDPTLGPALMMTIDPYGNSLSLGNSSIRAGSMDMTLTDIEWAKATPIPAQ